MLALSLVVCLQFDVYLKCDILAVINLPSTTSLEFAYNCRRRYLVFILVQCLLIFLHLRKPLKADICLTGSALSCSPIYSYFCWQILSSFLLSSACTPPLICFSSLPTVSVSLSAGKREKRVISSPVGLWSHSSVFLRRALSVRVRRICVSADSVGKTEYLVTPVLICRLLCSSNASDSTCRVA